MFRLFLISGGVVIIDQITKLLTKRYMTLGQSKQVLGNFVRYTYIENTGMAFGISLGNRTFFTIFSIIASAVILVYLFRTRGDRFPVRLSLALILGGAIGNLIDRILYGSVVDFIEVGIGSLRWPVFNVADSAVTCGMIILLALVIFERDGGKAHSDNAQPNPSQ